MDNTEILSQLEYNTGLFPLEALQEAIRQKDAITPALLQLLRDANDNIEYIAENPDYMAHLYAMFLLAQFREKQAYPLISDLFSHPGDLSDRIAEDFVCEDLPRVFASVCHGDTSRIIKLIENKKVDPYVRGSCIHALLILVVSGQKTRQEVMEYYQSLFSGRLERVPSVVWDSLVICSCDLRPVEVYEDIKNVFAERLIDPNLMSLSHVKSDLEKGYAVHLEEVRSDVHNQLVDDTIRSMQWWACFVSHEKKKSKPFPKVASPPIEQRRRTKIGRNEPCPCGSGKKYKKCCGGLVKTVTSSP